MATVRDEGYTVTDVPGLNKVTVRWDSATEDAYVVIVIHPKAGTSQSFDLEGFRDYVEGMHEVLTLAEAMEKTA